MGVPLYIVASRSDWDPIIGNTHPPYHRDGHDNTIIFIGVASFMMEDSSRKSHVKAFTPDDQEWNYSIVMLVGRVLWVYLWVYLSSSDKAIGTLTLLHHFGNPSFFSEGSI